MGCGGGKLLEIRLKDVRKEKHITQKELSKKSGYTQAYISQLESGKIANPSLNVVSDLAKSLKVCPFKLLKHTDKCCECNKESD